MMLRKLLLLTAGVMLALLGVLGLVLPVLPGLVFLAGAALCFSVVSRRFKAALHGRLRHNPRYRHAMIRWRAAGALRPAQRLRLAFWLAAAMLVPQRRTGGPA